MNQTRIVASSASLNAFNLFSKTGSVTLRNNTIEASEIIVSSGSRLNLTEGTSLNALNG